MKQWANSNKSGFTIVELLIVVVVIAILAAITIVSYNGINTRAKQAASASATKQAATKIMAYAALNGEVYPADTAQAGLSETGGTSYQYKYDNTAKTFCVTALTGGISYYASSEDQTPRAGACPGHGANGATTITNIVHDPRATISTSGVGMVGWRTSRWFGSVPSAGTYTLVTGASDGPVGIPTYLRKTWTNVTGNGDLGFEHSGGSSTGVATVGAVIQPNTTYTFSSYVRASSAYNGGQIQVWWHDAAGVHISNASSTRVNLPANTWVRLVLTTTSPATAATVGVVSDLDGQVPSAGMVLDGTGLMISATSSTPQYADGYSAGWAWNGTPNNSFSSGPEL